MALERGIALEDLRNQGLSEPFHSRDLETFEHVQPLAMAGDHFAQNIILEAQISAKGFEDFINWLDGDISQEQLLVTFLSHAFEEDQDQIAIQTIYHQSNYKPARIVLHDWRNSHIFRAEGAFDAGINLILTQKKSKLVFRLESSPQLMNFAQTAKAFERFAQILQNPINCVL